MTAGSASPEPTEGSRARWPLYAAILLVLAAAGSAWWLLRGIDPAGVWVGHLDSIQVELHLRDDGTFDWYITTPGLAPAQANGRPRASQWQGTWRLSEGELELHYKPKPPRKAGGVRYGRFNKGTLRTTVGLGAERAALRRQVP